MLLRISLIVAIIAALAVGVLNFVMVKDKIETVERHRAEEQAAKEDTQRRLADTQRDLEKTTTDLAQTKATLETTTEERDRFQAEVATQTRRAGELTTKLAETTTELGNVQAQLQTYKATGYTPEQILGFDGEFKKLRDNIETVNVENKALFRKWQQTDNRLKELIGDDWRPPPLPAELRGKVLVCDPKWDFVILDVGEEQGVLEKGEVLVSRNGKLVAKLSVRIVEKNRCIANVLPGWRLGDVMEGDQILPAS